MISEEMSDEDLLTLIEAKSRSAEVALYDRYIKHSKSLAKYYCIEFKRAFIAEEDYASIIASKIEPCISTYIKEKVNVKFYHYWSATVRHAVYTFVRSYAKHLFMDDVKFIYLDEAVFENNDLLTFHDTLGEDDSYNSILVDKIKDLILNSNNTYLNKQEKLLAKALYIDFISIQDFAKINNLSTSNLYYKASRLKKKILKQLKHSYL